MSTQPRFFVPEVVQTSEMDCGPASLKALLEGFGISASYGRLREACQTEVDGTSIDVIEQVAIQLGLDAEQIMIPADHLLLPEANALPALVVVRLPNGMTHFIIIWSKHGRFVQVMDPGTGRRWVDEKRLLADLYIHRFPVPAEAFREWAGTEGFLAPLRRRLAELQMTDARIDELISQASARSGLARAGGAGCGGAHGCVHRACERLGARRDGGASAGALFRGGAAGLSLQDSPVPAAFWFVEPLPRRGWPADDTRDEVPHERVALDTADEVGCMVPRSIRRGVRRDATCAVLSQLGPSRRRRSPKRACRRSSSPRCESRRSVPKRNCGARCARMGYSRSACSPSRCLSRRSA